MAEAPHPPEEMIRTLARIVKGAGKLYRTGGMRSDRVDDPLVAMALDRAEIRRFKWTLDKSQQQQLQELRSSFRDIEDWITNALEASKDAVPKERHRRLSARCTDALSEIEDFLAFSSFRISGKLDKGAVRRILKGEFAEVEETSAELEDCIGRVGGLPAASTGKPATTEMSTPADRQVTPSIQIAFVAPGVRTGREELSKTDAPTRKMRTARKKPGKKRGIRKSVAKPRRSKRKAPDDEWIMNAPKGLHRHTAQKLWEAALKLDMFRRVELQETAGIGESPAKRFLAFAEGEGKLRTNRSERKTNQEAIIYTVARR